MKANNVYRKIYMTALVIGLFSGCICYPDQEEETTTQVIKEDPVMELKRYHTECIHETQVKPDLVIHFKSGSWKEDKLLKKWVLCVLHKRDLMTLEGVYKLDVALSRIPDKEKDIAQLLIIKCLSPKAMLPEDIAWNYVKCHRILSKGKLPSIGVLRDNIKAKNAEKNPTPHHKQA